MKQCTHGIKCHLILEIDKGEKASMPIHIYLIKKADPMASYIVYIDVQSLGKPSRPFQEKKFHPCISIQPVSPSKYFKDKKKILS